MSKQTGICYHTKAFEKYSKTLISLFGTTELAQGQIESLNYFLDMVQAYLQGVISDTENETEENRFKLLRN